MKNVAIKGKYTPQNRSKFLSRRKPVYRSMWERRFMIYCDRSESILEWDSESIHIPYVSPKDNRWHNYYPDLGNRKLHLCLEHLVVDSKSHLE